MKILVLNSGSSSQKASLYEIGSALPAHPPAPLWEGRIEFSGTTAVTVIKNSLGTIQREEHLLVDRGDALKDLLSTLRDGRLRAVTSFAEIDAVGHRVVYGGPNFEAPVAITSEVLSSIADVAPLAPLHIRAELEGMDLVEKLLGKVPQFAVFDTGFHRRMPLSAAIYPGPYDWYEKGIRRYGFHGINHQYCAGRAALLLGKDSSSLRLVTCHLGNGCSLAAIDAGRCLDTTMGFTPLDGLMMGTRSGSVDPGILIYLMRHEHRDAEQLDNLLNHESGLLGISGLSSDMRDIVAAIGRGHERAKLAFDIFVHRLHTAIGGMIAVLGGIDALVFTGGMGENSPDVRAAACGQFGFLGLKIDAQRNASPLLDADISAADSSVRVLAIRAEEDWAIATECWKLANRAP